MILTSESNNREIQRFFEESAFVNKRKAVQHAENKKHAQQKMKRKGYK